jgi:hypothetical protein
LRIKISHFLVRQRNPLLSWDRRLWKAKDGGFSLVLGDAKTASAEIPRYFLLKQSRPPAICRANG